MAEVQLGDTSNRSEQLPEVLVRGFRAEELHRVLPDSWAELRRLPDPHELVAMRGTGVALSMLAQDGSRSGRAHV